MAMGSLKSSGFRRVQLILYASLIMAVINKDDLYKTIGHYQKFPCMIPWIGENYTSSLHKRLLVVGESHYLPEDSKIHKNPEAWYLGSQNDLCNEEVKWISTEGIIKKNKPNNFSKRKSHVIYKNIGKAINSCSFKYPLPSDIFDHIAYYNYFQRPAESSGDSIKVSRIDKEVAEQVLTKLITLLEPEIVIFTSKLSANFGYSNVIDKKINAAITPHPSCSWWNRSSKKYNGKGSDVIPNFLIEKQWLK